MKDFFKKIVEFLKDVFELIEKNEVVEEPIEEIVEEPILEPIEEEIIEEPIIEQEEIKQPVNDLKTTPKEVYKMLTNKQRQTYLKKLGLYTKSIDGIRGTGQKKAEKQFNIIFLNVKNDTYTEATDKLLREVYKSYNASPYMVASDWKYFKNFKESEFFCTCKKKYCDGYNGLRKKIPMHLLMVDQYIRNYYNKPVSFSCSVRCEKRNAEVGGIKNSKHIKFRANDFKCTDVKSSKVVDLIYKGSNKLPFVGYSYSINTNYTHVDVTI